MSDPHMCTFATRLLLHADIVELAVCSWSLPEFIKEGVLRSHFTVRCCTVSHRKDIVRLIGRWVIHDY